MNSLDSRKFEEEVEEGLTLDDVAILENRIYHHDRYRKSMSEHHPRLFSHSRTQWTRIHDGIQEHFSSHVLINGVSHRLPPNIYALKQISKQSWMLYKKRECERRKRLRLKIESERKIQEEGGPANILLSMVDACEICKKLYVTVNLFWGLTICDLCYFNEDVIKEIMKKRKELIGQTNSFTMIPKVIAKPNANEAYFSIPQENDHVKSIESSPEVVPFDRFYDCNVEKEAEREPPEPDIRPISTYISPAPISDEETDSEIVKIHEEDEEGNVLSEDESISFDGYFSQTKFLDPENLFSN